MADLQPEHSELQVLRILVFLDGTIPFILISKLIASNFDTALRKNALGPRMRRALIVFRLRNNVWMESGSQSE